MPHALILQGWPQPTTSHWYSWLKEVLTKHGWQVDLPELPTMMTSQPQLQLQLDAASSLIQPSSTIIGHSLGALLALRLAEKHPFHHAIITAGFDFDDLTEGLEQYWPNKINHQAIINHTHKRTVVHSDNDPYVTESIASEMAKRLDAQFILIKNGGHFMVDDGYATFPDLVQLILKEA